MTRSSENIRKKRNFMDLICRLSLMISTIIIVVVLVISIVVISIFTAGDLNRSASATADQISTVLMEPLYNVDDYQTLRIMDTLLSSGRVAGAYLESSATGILVDEIPSHISPWIQPQRREITFRDIYLGRLDIYFSASSLTDLIGNIFTIMLAIVAAVIVANIFVSRMMIKKRVQKVFSPIEKGIREISHGNYTKVLDDSGYEDMDSFITVLNDMSRSIRNKNEELVRINAGLEDRVAARTRELKASLNEQHQLQDRLVESGKLSVLGQLSAGIAHELNTPLGAIQSSARSLTDFFDTTMTEIPLFSRDCNKAELQLFDTLMEIGLNRNKSLDDHLPERKIVQSIAKELEKAGVHEVNELADRLAEMGLENFLERIIPLFKTGRDGDIVSIVGNAVIARRTIEIINESSRKAELVISALRSYLWPHSDNEDTIVDIPANIGQVLTLMHNMLKHGITVYTDFTPVRVQGSADKLSQVWVNLIRNAAQAMEFSGELHISVTTSGDNVRVSIIDSGPGIPEEIVDQIFNPLFTTKLQGDGMGLGLDIAKKIIESHNGTIEVTSRPGKTEFLVILPMVEKT